MNNLYKFYTFLVSGVLFVVGVILIVAGISYDMNNKSFMASAVPVTATIDKIETRIEWDGDKEYDVYVSFAYEGKEYSNKELNYHRSSMKEGIELDIYFNPLTNDIGSPNVNNFAVRMFYIFGTAIILLGLMLIVLFIIRNRKLKTFISNAIKIEGHVESIKHTGISGVLNKHPYVVKCSYYHPETGDKYYAESSGLKRNPIDLLKHDTTVDIYVDSTYTQYFVDIESALAKAKDNPYK